MKIRCDRERLWRAFQTAASVVPARSPKPILRNIKLDATADAVTLTATDQEVGIRIDVAGIDVGAPGSVVLPVDRVGAILRESSDEKISIESDASRIRVETGTSQFQLPSEDPAEFPGVGEFDEQSYHELPARFFRELIRRTTFATDNESSRYALGGVLLELGGEEVLGVGTDGRRLAKQVGPAKIVGSGGAAEGNTIVPTRAMHLMERALADNDEAIQVTARANEIVVRSQKTTILSRLVEGRFPNWRGVFPDGVEITKIDLTVGPFFAAVRQAAIVTSDERRGVEFRFGDGKVVLSAHGAELGESHVEMPTAYDGAELHIKLDPRFVSEFLKVLEPDTTFTLELVDADTAAVCRTADGYSYVVMPLSRNQ
ncbi:MAG: DNA polymerase III subunit beta [Pirellulales bacterium]|nr:DNA polymerase III subunit beta [Pirellulales bacterium]